MLEANLKTNGDKLMFEIKRDIAIGIVEKEKKTSSDTGMHNRAITVLHA